MKVDLKPALSDCNIDAQQKSSQRQLSLSFSAYPDEDHSHLSLNLCLVFDCSNSVKGTTLDAVKQAAIKIIEKLNKQDRLSVIVVDRQAKVLIPNQLVENLAQIKQKIKNLKVKGGTAIDESLKLGIQQIAIGQNNAVSHIFLLTNGENQKGDERRCLKLAQLAAEYNITINTLGFGVNWNQDLLEEIADITGGTLAFIEKPEQATTEFTKLFNRLQSIGLTNAYLMMELMPKVRLAKLKPVAQILPETIELPVKLNGNYFCLRLGDLMIDRPRVILVNLYINQLLPGKHPIASVQISYNDPALGKEKLLSNIFVIEVESQVDYKPKTQEEIREYVLTLAKYRQTKIAETKIQQSDRPGAVIMLQTAAKTASQLADKYGAAILQSTASNLKSGKELSEIDKKMTRIVAKTRLG
ncbi:MAG: VWA domain-containing protein [Xenococcaceae cyanobacterium]